MLDEAFFLMAEIGTTALYGPSNTRGGKPPDGMNFRATTPTKFYIFLTAIVAGDPATRSSPGWGGGGHQTTPL